MTRKFNLSASQPLYQHDEDNATQLGGLLIYYSLNKYILNPTMCQTFFLMLVESQKKKKNVLPYFPEGKMGVRIKYISAVVLGIEGMLNNFHFTFSPLFFYKTKP